MTELSHGFEGKKFQSICCGMCGKPLTVKSCPSDDCHNGIDLDSPEPDTPCWKCAGTGSVVGCEHCGTSNRI